MRDRKLGVVGFGIRAVAVWVVIAALTVGFGALMLDRSAGLSCGNFIRTHLVEAGVAAVAAPYLYSVYVRRLRAVGDGAKLLWILLATSALYFALNFLASLSCGPSGAFALPIYGQIADQLASWLGGLVSLGWTALTLYAGLRQPAPNPGSAEHG